MQIIQYGRAVTPISSATGTTNTVTVNLPKPVQNAGRLLRAVVSIDKASGAFTTPSGWTLLHKYEGTSVSYASFYKSSVAGDQGVTISWVNNNGSIATIYETNLESFALHSQSIVPNPPSDTTATSISTSLPATTASVWTEAIPAIDTAVNGQWHNLGPNYDNGFAPVFFSVSQDAHNGGVNNGGSAHAMAMRSYISGETPSVTVSWVNADQPVLGLVAWSGTTSNTFPPHLRSSWVGGVTADQAVVTSKTVGASSVSISYSTDSTMAGAVTSTSATPNGDGLSRNTITGLTANTIYYYRVVADSTTLEGGQFKTMPSGQASFSFAFASCRLSNTNPAIFTTIKDRNPALFLQLGDFHYSNIGTNSPEKFRFAFNELTEQSNIRSLLANTASDYTWDDHDYGKNGADSNSLSRPAATSVYRERVPHYTLPSASGGIYHTFVAGRVRFIVLDTRSFRSPVANADDVNKTMLGSEQKTWFKDVITNATEKLTFIVSSVGWIGGNTETGEDHWGFYNTERNELASVISGAATKSVFLCGDMHALAADNGTNSAGNIPVLHASPLAQSNSIKGGPYSQGTYDLSSNQYGWVTITDNGTSIGFAYEGISADGIVRITLSQSYTLTATTVTNPARHIWTGSAWVKLAATSVAQAFVFSSPGNLSVTSGKTRIYVERAGVIEGVRASVSTAPAGSDIIIDVNLDGTTIYTDQLTRPKIAAAANTSGYVTLPAPAVAAGQYITVDIDQVGSTTAGADLSVTVWVK